MSGLKVKLVPGEYVFAQQVVKRTMLIHASRLAGCGAVRSAWVLAGTWERAARAEREAARQQAVRHSPGDGLEAGPMSP